MKGHLPSGSRIFVSARSLSEYMLMFNLSISDLSLRMLDCAAGGASFAAEARRDGRDVCAIDPLYAVPEVDRTMYVEAGYIRATKNIVDDISAYTWKFPSSPEEHRRLRRQSADMFLEDIRVSTCTYVAGRIEALPFADNSFDLVLSSHFLFTYADQIGIEDHIKCVLEMVRVSTTFVRIYPIVGFETDASSALKAVTDCCTNHGHSWACRDVPYQFLNSSGQMLEIRKAAGASPGSP